MNNQIGSKSLYKMLVVDDESITRMVYENIFSKHFDIYIASGGEEALELLGKHIFHIVLTDINMPNISGINLAKNIRSRTDENSKAIILGVTAAPQSIYDDAMNAGIDRVFAKPIEFLEVQAFVSDRIYDIFK